MVHAQNQRMNRWRQTAVAESTSSPVVISCVVVVVVVIVLFQLMVVMSSSKRLSMLLSQRQRLVFVADNRVNGIYSRRFRF